MKLEGITKIKQTSTESEVNEYLAKGYRIFKVFSTKITTDQGEFVQPTYILGLGKEE